MGQSDATPSGPVRTIPSPLMDTSTGFRSAVWPSYRAPDQRDRLIIPTLHADADVDVETVGQAFARRRRCLRLLLNARPVDGADEQQVVTPERVRPRHDPRRSDAEREQRQQHVGDRQLEQTAT